MSMTPTEARATAARSGRWVMSAPTSRPPLLPPYTASCAVRRHALGDEVVGHGGEVVEDVLLALEAAGVVPGRAVLAAAAQVGDRQHATGREPAGNAGR